MTQPESGTPRPTPEELKKILARHLAWYSNQHKEPLPQHDSYLEDVDPAYPDWETQVGDQPQQAKLSGMDLSGRSLQGANLCDADLSSANLSDANMSGTSLRGANLNNAELLNTDLTGADIREAKLNGATLNQAKLKEANLAFAELNDAWLPFADLRGASLAGAKLINAKLARSNLSSADLAEATLSFAELVETDLTGARMFNANLTGAKLWATNLCSANLSGTNLSCAELKNTNIAKTRLDHVNLTNAVYTPASEPPSPHVAGIQGLLTVRIPLGEQDGLVQLRKAFQDAGLRDLERQATCRIERANTAGISSAIRSTLRWFAFDLTTKYGLQPVRALYWIIVIWFLCALVYCWPIAQGPGQSRQSSGIYRVLPGNRIGGLADDLHIEKDPEACRIRAATLWEAVPPAAYFSLLSAVNIGFEQFTPGDWIRRLQLHEYELRAEGWVRCVAGLQALLSVFLLAMWVLTQFGRPFQ